MLNTCSLETSKIRGSGNILVRSLDKKTENICTHQENIFDTFPKPKYRLGRQKISQEIQIMQILKMKKDAT